MRTLRFPSDLRSVVCLGAHPDDIEIGAGATTTMLAHQNPEAEFRFVILTGSDERKKEAISSASDLLGDRVKVAIGSFSDGFVPYKAPADAKHFVRSSIPAAGVDLVIAPQLDDRHQDHRFVAELAVQLFREQPILGYEIVKYDGGLVAPNIYVPLTESAAHAKAEHVLRYFPSQAQHRWFTPDALVGLMRIRGIEANAPEGYAESFVSHKIVLS